MHFVALSEEHILKFLTIPVTKHHAMTICTGMKIKFNVIPMLALNAG
jgi:hypothetical protein